MAYVIIDATVARLERGGGRLQEKTKEKIEGQSVSYEDSNRIHRDIHQFIIILSLYALSNKNTPVASSAKHVISALQSKC